jgi:pescadillo protein
MGKRKKKGECGAATSYISRNQALKKLQLSLPDFRRLCILKGIYPHEPPNVKKVNKGSTAQRTFYYYKDIQFLAHEPLLEKFREFKEFMKRVRRAAHKNNPTKAEKMMEKKPVYTLDHIVRERYPTFTDALRDIDDALTMIFLFSTLPQYRRLQAQVVHNCKRLCVEFMHFLIESRSLRKVFLSIKGVYYQAEIQGQTITWITPYSFTQKMPSDVDFRVMLTFVEFYATLVGFINFKLYHSLNLKYPPQIEGLTPLPEAAVIPSQVVEDEDSLLLSTPEDDHTEILASLGHSLARVVVEEAGDEADDDEEEIPVEMSAEEAEARSAARREEQKLTQLKSLFDGCRFFLSREVPREALTFIIRCFGGAASWETTSGKGASLSEPDEGVTHQVVDRPLQAHRFLGRHYVQPQWVFDSVNRGRLLPTSEYSPGSVLPPHLSPFVREGADDYVPPERQMELREEAEEEEEEGDMETEDQKVTERVIPTVPVAKVVRSVVYMYYVVCGCALSLSTLTAKCGRYCSQRDRGWVRRRGRRRRGRRGGRGS